MEGGACALASSYHGDDHKIMLVRTSQRMKILFFFDAKLQDAGTTRTHLQVETVGEGCWR